MSAEGVPCPVCGKPVPAGSTSCRPCALQSEAQAEQQAQRDVQADADRLGLNVDDVESLRNATFSEQYAKESAVNGLRQLFKAAGVTHRAADGELDLIVDSIARISDARAIRTSILARADKPTDWYARAATTSRKTPP